MNKYYDNEAATATSTAIATATATATTTATARTTAITTTAHILRLIRFDCDHKTIMTRRLLLPSRSLSLSLSCHSHAHALSLSLLLSLLLLVLLAKNVHTMPAHVLKYNETSSIVYVHSIALVLDQINYDVEYVLVVSVSKTAQCKCHLGLLGC